MILTISDSEEGILNKIKSVLACESTLEVMEITNSEKLTFQGLEIDQLQRAVQRGCIGHVPRSSSSTRCRIPALK